MAAISVLLPDLESGGPSGRAVMMELFLLFVLGQSKRRSPCSTQAALAWLPHSSPSNHALADGALY